MVFSVSLDVTVIFVPLEKSMPKFSAPLPPKPLTQIITTAAARIIRLVVIKYFALPTKSTFLNGPK